MPIPSLKRAGHVYYPAPIHCLNAEGARLRIHRPDNTTQLVWGPGYSEIIMLDDTGDDLKAVWLNALQQSYDGDNGPQIVTVEHGRSTLMHPIKLHLKRRNEHLFIVYHRRHLPAELWARALAFI